MHGIVHVKQVSALKGEEHSNIECDELILELKGEDFLEAQN